MKKINNIRKWSAAWVVIAFTWMAVGVVSPAQAKTGKAKAESAAATMEATNSSNSANNSYEKEGEKQEIVKKNRFPWLVMAAGTILAGAIIYLAFIKPTKHLLTVDIGTGASGTPASGRYQYKKGEKISYGFACADGYKNLTVFLDDKIAAASGMIVMDRAHSIRVEAAQLAVYSLIVTMDDGIDGTPPSGSNWYWEGTVLPYHYTSADQALVVKLDSILVPASGAFVMDRNHDLQVSYAAPPDIRGKWHFVIQDAKSTQANPLMDISLSGTQTKGVVEVTTVYCYQDTFFCCWEIGKTNSYEVNSTSNLVKIYINPNYNTFMWFTGNFKSNSTISGNCNFKKSDGPGLQEVSGTWTASRIK